MAWAQIAALAVQAVVAIGGAIGDKSRSNQARDRAEAAQQKLDQQADMLNMLDTSNPYMNMENTLEDLTINQKQAEFERQSINQQQANIMDQLKQGAGFNYAKYSYGKRDAIRYAKQRWFGL
jgi:hypothetical protein